MNRTLALALTFSCAALLASVSLLAQNPAPQPTATPQAPAAPGQPGGRGDAGAGPARAGGGGGRGGGGGARGQVAPPADDYAGFTSIFDGKTLNGWDGDPRVWRAENGVIVGETTPTVVLTDNTFIVWRGGVMKDFELKVEARFAQGTGNSGIQVRSKMMTEPTGRTGGQPRPWGMGGYQVEVSQPVSSALTGTLLEEGAGMRGFLSTQGQVLRKVESRGSKLMGNVGPELNTGINPPPEFNAFHIIGVGPQITVMVNGRVTQIVVDEDKQLRALEGLLGFQMHAGGPFKMEFRNIYLKTLN